MVTLDDLKAHLNITTATDDGLLQNKLAAALQWVANWIGGDFTVAFPDGTPEPLNEAVRQLAASWYVNREAVSTEERHALAIPFGVHDLIQPYRQWAF